MPGGDRTGPAGAGAMTGRGAGYCAGNDMPGYASGGCGMGVGMGRGVGRGRGFFGFGRGLRNFGGFGWRAFGGRPGPVMPADEKAVLEKRAELLQCELDRLNRRLESIESKA